MFKRKMKKLTGLKLKEISGVDHPASLHEGWAVIKSSGNENSELDEALADIIYTDESLEKNVEDVIQEETEVEVAEVIEAESATDVVKELEDVRKELQEAKTLVATLEENSAMEKANKDSQKWGNIPGIVPDEFAPVLRSLRAADAEVSEQIETILDAVAVALGEVGILKEIGSDGSPETDDVYGQIETLAKAMVDNGSASSLADGIGKVATENPELYSAYVAEMGA